MAIMWIVWALDEEMVDWLKSQDIPIPSIPSRFPTIGEIRRALDHPELRVDIRDHGPNKIWQAIIESGSGADHRWANLIVDEYTGEGEPQKFHFEKGDETLIRAFLQRLAIDAGPLVLIDDVGDTPQVIVPE